MNEKKAFTSGYAIAIHEVSNVLDDLGKNLESMKKLRKDYKDINDEYFDELIVATSEAIAILADYQCDLFERGKDEYEAQ